jgi:hypothetical protein
VVKWFDDSNFFKKPNIIRTGCIIPKRWAYSQYVRKIIKDEKGEKFYDFFPVSNMHLIYEIAFLENEVFQFKIFFFKKFENCVSSLWAIKKVYSKRLSTENRKPKNAFVKDSSHFNQLFLLLKILLTWRVDLVNVKKVAKPKLFDAIIIA